MPRFAFDFDSVLSVPLRLALIGPRTSSVRVERGILDVRFGLLRLRTPVDNVADVVVTGPYHPLKVLGVHVSLSDLGLTFGSGHRQGVCIRFRRSVSGVLPVPLLRHPALTVTVAEPGPVRDTLVLARDTALAEQERLRDAHAHHAVARTPRPMRVIVPTDSSPATPLTARTSTRTASRASAAKRTVRSAAGKAAEAGTAKRTAREAATARGAAKATARKGTAKQAPTARRPAPEREVDARRLAGNLPDVPPEGTGEGQASTVS